MSIDAGAQRPPRLPELIANQIEESLLAEGLKVGEQLPTEPQLVAQYGVSRTVIREAARILEQRGLVDIRSGRGMTVLGLNGAPIAQHYSRLLRANPRAFEQLMQARSLIEVPMAGLAAKNRNDEDLADLRRSLERVRSNLHDSKLCLEEDLRFHSLIGRACGNPMMSLFVDPVNQCLRELYEPDFEYMARLGATLQEHEAILEALEAGDAEQAERLTEKHLERVRSAGPGDTRRP